MRSTDIRVRDISFSYEDYAYRSPIKFGGLVLDRVTLINVTLAVETRGGKTARGFGSMPLGNVWSFPSRVLSYDQTLAAMKALAGRVSDIYKGCAAVAHPIDLTHELEPAFFPAAAAVTRELALAEPIPKLCALVVASPFDAALHDAFGKAHGLNCFKTYGPDFMSHDLGHYLGDAFKGETLDRYVTPEPKPRMPLYHLVGALDPLTDSDVKQRINDGLPETLGEWIRADGLTHLKIKLNGDDLGWDVNRVVGVNAVAEDVQRQRGVATWFYSLDFNERCPNVEYLLEFLRQVEAKVPAGFARIQYIEQPTARDLRANPANKMHAAAKIRPVVIDESLIDLESLHLAREVGYTGVAFKACKGQSQSMLLAAAAQKFGMFRCVQDLSCPGASLIQSAGIAAHVPGVAAIEANSRQYCPASNAAWAPRFPGVFAIRDGTMNTAILNGPGLGAV
jgi:L-alanine-DL-glutamate epimerase-like enolase superfamily enzyme